MNSEVREYTDKLPKVTAIATSDGKHTIRLEWECPLKRGEFLICELRGVQTIDLILALQEHMAWFHALLTNEQKALIAQAKTIAHETPEEEK